MSETDQQPGTDAPPPPPPTDSPWLVPPPPLRSAAATRTPVRVGRGAQVAGFLRNVSWSKISLKGWIVIAIVVMIPIGLIMKAFGHESTASEPAPAARSGASAASAADVNVPTNESPEANAAIPSNTGANPFGGDAPEDSLMPDLICMNLQDAQNEIQDHGVFFSGSVDATGQGRHQIIDSNWVVVGQSPSAGSPIGEGDAELSVVKYGETTLC